MQAKDLMTRSVECISPQTRISNAAQRMKLLDVGFLPVCENDRLVGTVTDRDIALRVVAEGNDVNQAKAGDIMTSDVFWCYEDQTADEIADYMSQKVVRRVLILNRNKRLVGVLSIGDLAKRGEDQKAGRAIKEITEAPPAQAA